ncbi:MAG: phosphatidate cytidylyltransferase [Chloroflexi bacterium]|nr:phosphatidate cytidylyltransferase [Chloroflexota bacterium]
MPVASQIWNRGRRLFVSSPLFLRVVTAAPTVPIVVVAILEGGGLWAAIVALTLVVAMIEFGAAVGISRRDPLLAILAAAAAAIPAVALLSDIPRTWPLTAALLALAAFPIAAGTGLRLGGLIEPTDIRALAPRLAYAVFALIYFAWLGSFLVALRELPQGEEWTLLALFAVMAADTGAFVVGKLGGRRLLVPQLSPNKTVEGALGGFAAGFATVLLINLLPDLNVPLEKMVILAFVLPLMAGIGDLAESTLKRSLNVKDLGGMLPGHGGVPDRLDSLLFGVPTVYFFVLWAVI